MPTPQATENFYRTLQRLQVVLVLAGRRAWTRMGSDFDASWSQVAPPLVRVTSAAQLAAATAATAYVPAVLDETGQPDEPEARVRPRAFAGVASDGRSLAGLLTGAVARSKAAVGRGLGPEAALDVGGQWLEGLLQGAVTDAARDATATEVLTRDRMGWVRQVNPPCCSRCAVLAGTWYRWSEGFQRHPRCDCLHIPSVEDVAGDFTTDPEQLVRRGLITDLTEPQRQRIADGANLPKVLNESRDAWRARMAADRQAAKRGWGSAATAPPTATVNDFLAHLTSRAGALNAARANGYVT